MECCLSLIHILAIRKAFGWSNYNLICAVVSEMAEILLVSLCIGFLLIEVFSRMTEGIISIHITPFFLCGTLLLLSLIHILVRWVLKRHPADGSTPAANSKTAKIEANPVH